jgi:small-conductance mechanosensitive channel
VVDQTWTAALAAAVARVGQRVLEFLPSILGCLFLLAVGWVAAKILRALTRHLAERTLQGLTRTKSIQPTPETSRTYRSMPLVLSGVVFWTVLLFFSAAAVEALGLPAVSNVLGAVTVYLPRLLLGLLIVGVGFWAADVVRALIARTAARSGFGHSETLGRVAQLAIIFLAIIIAVDQIGVDSTVLVTSLATAFGATLGAVALAFGLGARTTVGNIIAARYVQKAYRVGDSVRIGALEGVITDITDTAVMLQTPEGRVMVPAQRFTEEVSILIRETA